MSGYVCSMIAMDSSASCLYYNAQHPLSPLQAFAICLSTIDSKFADLKVYENMTKLLKKK